MIIRKPTREDLTQLSALWQEAFGDSPEDVENFYETAFSYDRALLTQEQDPVACIYWMDAQISGQKIAYLYAFAVAKTHRGKGVGKNLLEKALEKLKGEGYQGAVLVPGEESLYSYYEKIGFLPFGKTQKTVVKKTAPGLSVRKLSGEDYFTLRQRAKADAQWTKEAFSYLGRFCDFYAGEDWLLAINREEVQEFLGNPENLPHILYTLDREQVQTRLPGKNPCAVLYSFAPFALPDTFSPSF